MAVRELALCREAPAGGEESRCEAALVLLGHALGSETLLVARLDACGRVIECSPALARLLDLAPRGDPRPIGDLLLAPLPGARLPLRPSARPLPVLARARASGETLVCHRYPLAGGSLLVAERQRQPELDLVETLTELATELAGALRRFERRTRELAAANRRITEISLTDPLTGLANRRHAGTRLEAAVSHAERHARPLAVVLADLDHFKRVNDRHGHHGGDRALVAFAAVLRECSRREDVIARHGGEEFLVVMPETTAAAARDYAERVRRAYRTARPLGPEVALSASFGVAERRPGEDGESLLRRADRALYRAKRAGRDRVA